MQLANQYYYFKSIVSPEDCQKIIEVGTNKILEDEKNGINTAAWVHGSLEKQSMPDAPPAKDFTPYELSKLNLKDKSYVRDSYVSWLTPVDYFPLYQKLTDAVNEVNNRYFNFDLFGFGEAMQFTKYIAPTGKYGQHIDRTLNGYVRKLSIVAQLTDPKEYEGGELVLYTQGEPIVLEKKKGKVYFFPSYILHEVKPVTKGERCSLVAWLTGPQFR